MLQRLKGSRRSLDRCCVDYAVPAGVCEEDAVAARSYESNDAPYSVEVVVVFVKFAGGHFRFLSRSESLGNARLGELLGKTDFNPSIRPSTTCTTAKVCLSIGHFNPDGRHDRVNVVTVVSGSGSLDANGFRIDVR